MAQQVVNVGAVANDRTGDTWRDAFVKVNANETELYADVAALQVPSPTGIVVMAGNATTSTIATINTPVLVAGAFAVGSVSSFDGTTAGRLTYTGTANAVITISAVVDIEPASGTGKDLTVYIAVNGSVAATSGRIVTTDASLPLNASVIWQSTLSTNDYIELYVENNTDNIDVLVSGAVLVVS